MSEFKQDTEITPVIFRRFGARKGGEVIALFFEEPGDYDSAMCSSYVHVGQHGSASPHYVVNNTKAATPCEYEALRQELESAPYGYRLKIYKRLPRSAMEVRRKKLDGMR